MRNYFHLSLISFGLFALGTVYGLSRTPSEAQTMPTPQNTPKVAKPADTLDNWAKKGNSESWTPFKFLKVEVGQPKPVKNWMVSEESDESANTRYAITMTTPELPPIEPRPGATPNKADWQEFVNLVTHVDITIVQALYRPLPNEPWVSITPGSESLRNSNLSWDFGIGVTQVPTWTRKGNVLRAEDGVSCPGGGQWKLKVRFRAKVSDFLSEKRPQPVWALEKTFWVDTQMPHEGSVKYPEGLHEAWVNGLSFALSKNGPWKPVPQQGQPGFPLTWAGDRELFIRAEKKYPQERWPDAPQVGPKIELVKDGKTVTRVNFYYSYAYPGNYSVFHDSSFFTGLNEVSRMAMLTPDMQLGDRNGDELLTIKATAGNFVTAPLLVRRRPPEGIYNWAKYQRMVLKWSVGENDQQKPEQQAVYNCSIVPGTTGILKFNTKTIEYPFEGLTDSNYGPQVAQVSLHDANGMLLDTPPLNSEGKYQFEIKRTGRYVIQLEIPGPDGQPLHRRPDFRKTQTFASDLLQKVTVNVREAPLIATGPLSVIFGPWQPTTKTDVWQRTVTALNTNSIRSLKFKIRPLKGYKLDPNISWLAPQENMETNSASSSSQTVQFYRVLPTLPEAASRQMNVYDVEATGKKIDERAVNLAEVLK